jgi:acyl carrier protein
MGKGGESMSIKEQVLSILGEVKPTKNLEDVKEIVEGGYIDSFELMTLIMSLSEKFGIEISIEEITPENFNSIEAMTAMVERLIRH